MSEKLTIELDEEDLQRIQDIIFRCVAGGIHTPRGLCNRFSQTLEDKGISTKIDVRSYSGYMLFV